jgi:hypothetical protein
VVPPDRLKKGCTGPPLGTTTARTSKTNEREDREQIRQEEREEHEQVRQEEREDRKRERQKARGQEESSP